MLDRTILNAIPIPAFVVDHNVQILDMNSAAAQLCDRKHEVVYKCRGCEVFHCLHSTGATEGCGKASFCRDCVIRGSVTRCLEGQAVNRALMSMEFLPETGRKMRELLITTSPITAGRERLALLVVEDITAHDELEKALRRSEKLAVTGRLLTTLAHEINNPMESLGSLLYLLRLQPELGHKAKELVELVEQELARLAAITRQTLAPHRETKLPAITKLSKLLDDVLAVFRHRMDSARIKVRREYRTDGEVRICPGEFRQVFTNLIANAIDAMGGPGELRLSIERLPKAEIRVRVSDSGCGIPPEHLDTIFEPFFTTKGEEGTGIGLWVVKGIVENAGGRIEVASSTVDLRGTCFSIFLPASHWDA
jgi:signal transduction histidine kinase